MRARLGRILQLGIKELYSLRADPVFVLLILYTFTFAIYTVSAGAKFEVRDAAVAIVDEDRSILSARIRDAMLAPFFKPPVLLSPSEVDAAMDAGRFVFVVAIPPRFEQDLIAGRRPSVMIEVDATAMSLAGNGAGYLQSIIAEEVAAAVPASRATPISLTVRAKFNPNLQSDWFTAVMQVINNVTMLSVIIAGAALIRETEHGTIEHLLVMPIGPLDIMLAKVWANGLVIVVAAMLSLVVVVKGLLGIPIGGSLLLFTAASVVYQVSVAALGIVIATFARSMAQFGLLVMPVLIVMNLLSGSTTPMESMPLWLQYAMQVSPAPHFVRLSQAVLYRGADLSIVWPDMAVLALIGVVYLGIAARRFRGALLAFR